MQIHYLSRILEDQQLLLLPIISLRQIWCLNSFTLMQQSHHIQSLVLFALFGATKLDRGKYNIFTKSVPLSDTFFQGCEAIIGRSNKRLLLKM